MMKPQILLILAMTCAGTSACVSTYDSRTRQLASREADRELMDEQMRRLQGRLDDFDLQMVDLHREMDRLRADMQQGGSLQESSLTLKLDAMEGRMNRLEASRETDRQEIVDKLSEKISRIMGSGGTATASAPRVNRPASTSEFGFEHEVQIGETLSHIAQAYGVSIKSIIDANQLDNPNNLKVGQKLFIPE